MGILSLFFKIIVGCAHEKQLIANSIMGDAIKTCNWLTVSYTVITALCAIKNPVKFMVLQEKKR